MTDGDKNPWYTNKELFEKIGDLKDDVSNLSAEMKETRILIKSYNGLREQVNSVKKSHKDIEKQLQEIVNQNKTKRTMADDIKSWGGWVISIITVLILIYNQIN